ncbi:Uncharacterized protein OBRU01_26781 [Operophtera brumata]|uniref:Uncharacterized protein n=1 Tax=Operophtera brumata TaxID=104452 RepID=A0A0L7K3A1_OPEBR|nr:Uncharacterized protein OBRU01_26781 [Operophtera brumata]
MNVATLVFERRIRGVYQAINLTILSAWLHTCCWIASGLLALVRMLLAVDFQLVRVRAELQGDIDKMLVCPQNTKTDPFPTDQQSAN